VRWQARFGYCDLTQHGARHRFGLSCFIADLESRIADLRNSGSPWSAVASACWLL
jgi:hypothetical protein